MHLACNYPCSFDKSQNVLKKSCILGLLGGEPLNPQDRGLKSLLSWRGEGHVCSTPCVSVCICVKAANTTVLTVFNYWGMTCFDLSVSTVSTWDTTHNAFLSIALILVYQPSRHRIAFTPLKHDMLWSLVSTVSTCAPYPLNVHTTDKVPTYMNRMLTVASLLSNSNWDNV